MQVADVLRLSNEDIGFLVVVILDPPSTKDDVPSNGYLQKD